MDAARLLLDEVMPAYDTEIAERLIVAADPRATYEAARDLDFMTVHTPLLDAVFWMRTLPAQLPGCWRQPCPGYG